MLQHCIPETGTRSETPRGTTVEAGELRALYFNTALPQDSKGCTISEFSLQLGSTNKMDRA